MLGVACVIQCGNLDKIDPNLIGRMLSVGFNRILQFFRIVTGTGFLMKILINPIRSYNISNDLVPDSGGYYST